MEKGLVVIKNNESVIGTWDLSQGFGLAHRYLKEMIERYKKEFEEFGPVRKGRRNDKNEFVFTDDSLLMTTTNNKKKKGGQVEEYIINEEQYFFLATLCKNSEKIMKFKKIVTKEFFRMRKILIKLTVQQQNSDWLAKRADGIIERRVETDAIKDFIEYAKAQGSKSADKYYMIITKMENNSILNIELIHQKYENTRDMVEGFDLDALKMCDRIVAQTIRIGMNLQKHYKDIYQDARDKVEGFALAIGKTPLRLLGAK